MAALAAATFAQSAEVQDVGAIDATGYDVIVLGEVHDNPYHHDAQAELIDRVDPAAIVYEMLDPARAARLNALEPETPRAEMAEALDWATSGWPPFELYAPVFEAAHGIPAFGAALPPADVRRSVSEGAVALFGPGAARFGLDQPLAPDEQATRETGQADAHCGALPEEILPGFVEAQRLRDAHFARIALEALAAAGRPVIVITGNGHARTDWGMPAALARAAPDVTVLSLGQLEAPPDTPPPYDLWRVTAPAEREDPCAVFQ